MSPAYKEALEVARTELEQLIGEEGDLELRLQANRSRQAGLKNTVEGLSSLIGEHTEDPIIGITDAIRNVLKGYSSPNKKSYLTAIGIRDRLVEAGFNLNDYRNPMAVIHTTLKRLQDQQEVEAFDGKDKKIGYKWLGIQDVLNAPISDDDVPF